MVKQFLSSKWIPYEEIGEYLINKRNIEIKYLQHIKRCVYLSIGIVIIFIILLISFNI